VLQQTLPAAGWDHASLETAIRTAAKINGMKAKDLFMDLRLAVTGKTVGPPLLESLEILGRDETIRRLSP
jgi:glutamyl/glutaminyl-tRNA synthetase